MVITTGHWPKCMTGGGKMAKSKKDKNVGVELKVTEKEKYPLRGKKKMGKRGKKGK